MIVEVESSELSDDADAIAVSNEALMPAVFGDARPLSNTAILRGVVMVLIVSEIAVVKRTEYKPYSFETVSTFRYAHFNLFEPSKVEWMLSRYVVKSGRPAGQRWDSLGTACSLSAQHAHGAANAAFTTIPIPRSSFGPAYTCSLRCHDWHSS